MKTVNSMCVSVYVHGCMFMGVRVCVCVQGECVCVAVLAGFVLMYT